MVNWLYELEWNEPDKMLFYIREHGIGMALLWIEHKSGKNIVTVYVLERKILCSSSQKWKEKVDDLQRIVKQMFAYRTNEKLEMNICYDKNVCLYYDSFTFQDAYPLLSYLYQKSNYDITDLHNKIETRHMLDYSLAFLYKESDRMFFCIQKYEKPISLLLLEDANRSGELMRDFSFLYPQYYGAEEEWDDKRNMVLAVNYVLNEQILLDKTKSGEEYRDDLYCIAGTLIEERGTIKVKFGLEFDKK